MPPPVGKNSKSTVSRLGSSGSMRPGRFSSIKASWNASPARSFDPETLSQCALDGTVRHAKRIQRVFVVSQYRDPALHPLSRGHRLVAAVAPPYPVVCLSSGSISTHRISIQPRYCSTSGTSAVLTAAPSARFPSVRSSRAGPLARRPSTSSQPQHWGSMPCAGHGIVSSTVSHSTETLCPVA